MILKHIPTFFSEEDYDAISEPIGMKEVEKTLKGFSKDKNSGPDGWTVQFYLHLFDLLGKDLVEVIKESRVSGCIPDNLNTTYLTLIPIHQDSFVDYFVGLFYHICLVGDP